MYTRGHRTPVSVMLWKSQISEEYSCLVTDEIFCNNEYLDFHFLEGDPSCRQARNWTGSWSRPHCPNTIKSWFHRQGSTINSGSKCNILKNYKLYFYWRKIQCAIPCQRIWFGMSEWRQTAVVNSLSANLCTKHQSRVTVTVKVEMFMKYFICFFHQAN